MSDAGNNILDYLLHARKYCGIKDTVDACHINNREHTLSVI